MLVSVIIPCFNVEQYISECIDSVLSQTYQEFEIICIDNNSTDQTFAVLQAIAERFPNRIIISQEIKKGASAARNKGLSIAKGEWIQFLDADDLLLNSKLASQIGLLKTTPNASFVAAAFERQRKGGERYKVMLTQQDPFKGLFTSGMGITSSNLFRTSKLNAINGWNEELKSSQEADLMFRLLKNDKAVVFDNSPLTIIRERESGQISQLDPNKNWLQYIDLRLKIVDYLKTNEKEYWEKEEDFFNQKIFLQLRRIARFDLEQAAMIFSRYLGENFKPATSMVHRMFFHVFGFVRTEKIMRFFK